ncbi:hypothetical protein FS749_000409 [Ceratobasidium sp. UAMH 11750]|nr:hypothetical protein FS749_000409 [Ceratobasidium sp. UAMH 11750]
MSKGFLVFTCADSSALEVWRWAEDQHKDPVDCSPDIGQVYSYQTAMLAYEYTQGSNPIRGELVPLGVLRQPGNLQALRLAYPTLCVGSRDGTHLWLWDIRRRELIQTIDMSTSAGSAVIGMRYVDVNETHVFVVVAAVGKAAVSVYSRGTGQCVFRLTPEQLNRFCSSAHLPTRIEDSGNSFFRLALHPHSPTPTLVYPAPPEDQVMAVHVSPTGRDFVAATFCGYVLHVTGFDSTYQVTERGQLPARPGRPKISVTRVFNSRTTHLAYDGEHIVVTTVS